MSMAVDEERSSRTGSVIVMSEPKLTDFDQRKRGLQDDHDPNDLGQKIANKTQPVQHKPGEQSDPKNPKPEE